MEQFQLFEGDDGWRWRLIDDRQTLAESRGGFTDRAKAVEDARTIHATASFVLVKMQGEVSVNDDVRLSAGGSGDPGVSESVAGSEQAGGGVGLPEGGPDHGGKPARRSSSGDVRGGKRSGGRGQGKSKRSTSS